MFHLIQKLREKRGIPSRFIKKGPALEASSEDEECEEEEPEVDKAVEVEASPTEKGKIEGVADPIPTEGPSATSKSSSKESITDDGKSEKGTPKSDPVTPAETKKLIEKKDKLINMPTPSTSKPPAPPKGKAVEVITKNVLEGVDPPTFGTGTSHKATRRELLMAELMKVRQTIEKVKPKGQVHF